MRSRRRSGIKPRERIRKRGFEMLSEGVSKAEIARTLHVDYTAVWRWEKRLRSKGPDAWRDENGGKDADPKDA